jgi:hypothetical protein
MKQREEYKQQMEIYNQKKLEVRIFYPFPISYISVVFIKLIRIVYFFHILLGNCCSRKGRRRAEKGAKAGSPPVA